MTDDPRKYALKAIFKAGVAAAHPTALVGALPPLPPYGRLFVAAMGKAANAMAGAFEAVHDGPFEGIAVGRDEDAARLSKFEQLAAAHPLPDARSVAAAEAVLNLARRAGEGDLFLVLLSGGASALASAPADGVSLTEKRALVEALLRSGAPIEDINVVRRHLSRIKGGRLAAAAFPAETLTYAISDVVGDSPADIASGPTAPDPSTIADSKAVCMRHNLVVPETAWTESVKPGDPRLARTAYHVIGGAPAALEAAMKAARTYGYHTVLLDADLTGEARAVGARHGTEVLRCLRKNRRVALLSGGELTVTIKGDGRGGPNFEYCAGLGLALSATSEACRISALAGDTDGLDGNSGATGAFLFPLALKGAQGLRAALEANDTATFFDRCGDVFYTPPTGTNVNDLRIILIEP